MADVSKDLQLIYELANGKNHTLTIPDYKDGICLLYTSRCV